MFASDGISAKKKHRYIQPRPTTNCQTLYVTRKEQTLSHYAITNFPLKFAVQRVAAFCRKCSSARMFVETEDLWSYAVCAQSDNSCKVSEQSLTDGQRQKKTFIALQITQNICRNINRLLLHFCKNLSTFRCFQNIIKVKVRHESYGKV